MRANILFFVVFACAACAIDDDSDRSAGFFDRSSVATSQDAPPETPPHWPPACDESAKVMTFPHFVGAPIATPTDTMLRLTWSASDLPATFYEGVRVDDDSIVVATTPLNAQAMEITLGGVPATHSGKTETFTLLFPDVASFDGCVHRGSPDTYRVTVAVTFSDDAKTTNATFEGSVELGPI